tara:strand:- start:618 stop:6323 length:5706 start_codon:yes stop_codon:yes gene_type:complete
MNLVDINFASFVSNNILVEWSTAVSIVVAVVSASFVALLLLTNLFADNDASNRRKVILEAAKSAITSYILQFVNVLLEMIRKISELPTAFLIIWNTLLSSTTLIILILILSSVSYFIYNYDTFILMSLDSFYRCNVTPFVNNFVLSFLHAVAILWGAIVPIYNFFFVLLRQLIIGSFSIASKCTLTTFTFFDYIVGWTEVFIEFLTSVLKFSGATAGFSADNNFFVNKFDIASIVSKFRELHDWVPSIFTCMCEQVNLLWEILFYPLQDSKLDHVIDYSVNAFICLGQTVIQIVPPFLKYPNLSRFFTYVEGILFSSTALLDNWFLFTMNKMFDVIGANLIVEPPEPFIFRTGSHLAATLLGGVETATNVTIHTLLPVDPDIPFSNYGVVWSLDKSFFHVNIFITYTAYLFHWFSRSIIELLESDVYIERCFSSSNTKPFCLNAVNGKCSVQCLETGQIKILNMYQDCSASPFNINLRDIGLTNPKTGLPIYEQSGGEVDLFNTLACSFESFNKGTVNIFVVAYRLFLTFWWDVLPSIFEGGTPDRNSDFFPIIRNHVGPMFSRDKNPRCYVDVMKIDQTKAIDLYCDRANLNEHVLFYFDRAGDFFWGLFEPTSFGKVGLYLTTRPITEIIRVFLRVMSSLDILFEKDIKYIEQKMLSGYLDTNYPMNCDDINPLIPETTTQEQSINDNNNNMYFGASSYRLPSKAATFEQTSTSSTTLTDDTVLVDGVQTSFTDGKSQEGKIDVTTNNEEVTLTSAEAFDPFLGNNYKVSYTNIEVENWCNINLFEWFFIYTKRATEGAVRILSIFQDLRLPNSDNTDPCIDFELDIRVDRQYAPNINYFSVGGFQDIEEIFGYLKYLKTGVAPTYCNLEAPKATFCTFGNILDNGITLLRDLVRTQVRNLLNIFAGNAANLDLSHDICNFQKLEYAISNFAGSLVPVNGNQREGVNLILYSIIDIFGSYLITIQHLVSILVAPTPEGVEPRRGSLAAKLAAGYKIDVSTILENTLTFAINLIYRTVIQFIDGLYLFSDKNEIFLDLKTILNQIRLTIQSVKMLFLKVVKVGISFLGLFQSSNLKEDLDMILDDLFGEKGLVVEFFRVISEVMLNIVAIILNALGDFGDLIKKIIVGICDAADKLKEIFGKFPVLDCTEIYEDDDPLGLKPIREKEKKKQEEEAKKFEEDRKQNEATAAIKQESRQRAKPKKDAIEGTMDFIGDLTGSRKSTDAAKSWDPFEARRRRRLLNNTDDSKTFNLAKRISSVYEWDGESECDALVNAYSTVTGKISPLEEITLLKCYEYRVIGERINKFMPIFPVDMFYNWWRKYKFGFDVTRLSIFYIKAFINGDSQSSIKHKLTSIGFNPIDVFEFVNNVKKGFSHIKFNELHQNIMQNMKKEMVKNNTIATLYVNTADLMQNVNKFLHNNNLNRTGIFPNNHINVTELLNFTKFASSIKYPSFKDVFSNQTVKQLKRIAKVVKSNVTKTGKILFGQIYTDLKCNPNSPLCLNCALLDNFVFSAFDAANVSISYYTKNYTTKVVPEFRQYWKNVTEYNIRYIKGSTTSSTIFGAYEEVYYHSEVYPSYRHFDLNLYVVGLWEGTRDFGELIKNIEYFFHGNYTGEIPAGSALLFGPIDIQYILEWPWQQECTDAEFLYGSKVDRVGYGLTSVLSLYTFYYVATKFIIGNPPEPFNIIISSLLPLVSFLVYLIVVYQYNPLCLPSMNVWLIYDFLNYIEDFLFLDCFCSYFPFLSKVSCAQSVCDTCQIPDFTNSIYYTCSEPNLVTGFNELPIAWHFIFLLRWFFTDTFIYLEQLRIWPLTYFYEIDGVRLLLEDANANVAVSGIEESCFYLHIGVPISILLILYVMLLCLLPFVDFIVFYLKQLVVLALYLLLSVYKIGSTLLKEGLNTS